MATKCWLTVAGRRSVYRQARERLSSRRRCFNEVTVSTVLLVNCSNDEREMYAEYLKFRGFNTVEACEPHEALRLACDLQPDVIVTALGASSAGTDGFELIRQIRTTDCTKDATIIVVTGRVFATDREKALDAGCDVFLPKPLFPDVLLHEIHRVATSKRRRGFNASPDTIS